MAVGTYQLPNPRAVEPYAVETQLAHDIDNPLAMLAMYRSDRNLASQGYQSELENQHAFAQQQLAAQIAENRLKGFTDLAKIPGGVDFAATSGTGLDLGATPESLAALSGATNLAQNAENFQKTGSGWGTLAHAGLQIPPGMVPGLERYAGVPVKPTDTVQAAQIHAASSGDGHGGLGGSATLALPPITLPDGTKVTPSYSPNKKASEADWKADLVRKGLVAPSAFTTSLPPNQQPNQQGAPVTQGKPGGLPSQQSRTGAAPTGGNPEAGWDRNKGTLPPVTVQNVERARKANGGKLVFSGGALIGTDAQGKPTKYPVQ